MNESSIFEKCLIDPFNGLGDLKNGIIRTPVNPKKSFASDPLRILRAIRFACRFDFEIEEATFKKMKRMAINILNISKERWMMELDQILLSDNAGIGIAFLFECGLFKFMIPELHQQLGYHQNSKYHDFTLDVHTIKVVEAIRKDTDDLNMLWAGLLHDSGKVFCRTENKKGYSNYVSHEKLSAEIVLKYSSYLKWSKERTKKVYDLVLNHLNDDCPLRKYDNMGKGK